MTAKRKPVKAWAGFYDGKLDWYPVNDLGTPVYVPALFRNRRIARTKYQDVRRVQITIIKQRRKG